MPGFYPSQCVGQHALDETPRGLVLPRFQQGEANCAVSSGASLSVESGPPAVSARFVAVRAAPTASLIRATANSVTMSSVYDSHEHDIDAVAEEKLDVHSVASRNEASTSVARSGSAPALALPDRSQAQERCAGRASLILRTTRRAAARKGSWKVGPCQRSARGYLLAEFLVGKRLRPVARQLSPGKPSVLERYISPFSVQHAPSLLSMSGITCTGHIGGLLSKRLRQIQRGKDCVDPNRLRIAWVGMTRASPCPRKVVWTHWRNTVPADKRRPCQRLCGLCNCPTLMIAGMCRSSGSARSQTSRLRLTPRVSWPALTLQCRLPQCNVLTIAFRRAFLQLVGIVRLLWYLPLSHRMCQQSLVWDLRPLQVTFQQRTAPCHLLVAHRASPRGPQRHSHKGGRRNSRAGFPSQLPLRSSAPHNVAARQTSADGHPPWSLGVSACRIDKYGITLCLVLPPVNAHPEAYSSCYAQSVLANAESYSRCKRTGEAWQCWTLRL